jgi:hypothetical protein
MVKNHPESNAEFPFAIVQKGQVVALVKKERDARFIAQSEGHIHNLETDCSSLTLQKYGKNITERKTS